MIYGLSTEQLHPIVEAIAGEIVSDFSIHVERELEGFQGYCADKLLPTVKFATCSGRAASTTIFVKRFHFANTDEAGRYALLWKNEVPAPRCYGALHGQQGEEIVFLEFIPTIGFDSSDAQQYRQLLCLMARLNAIVPVPEVPAYDVENQISAQHETLQQIWFQGQRGNLGIEIKQFTAQHKVKLFQQLVERTTRMVAQMPLGWTHGDMASQNIGWRHEPHEMVVFDLHKMGVGPRFTDVQKWLGAPDKNGSESHSMNSAGATSERPEPREKLGQYYREEFSRSNGQEIDEATFWEEVTLLHTHTNLNLSWTLARALDGHVDWTSDREEGCRVYRGWLFEALNTALTSVV